MIDWKLEIAVACVVSSALHEADTKGIWEYHLPNIAASPERIADIERQMGFPLEGGHRQFLLFADGWRCFYQAVDLFGSADLCSREWKAYLEGILSALDPSILSDLGVGIDDFYVVAATKTDLDVFLIGRQGTKLSGSVLWLAGTLVDKYPSFSEFFLSMVDYNRMERNRLKGIAAQ